VHDAVDSSRVWCHENLHGIGVSCFWHMTGFSACIKGALHLCNPGVLLL
jgi:hypothetical protein